MLMVLVVLLLATIGIAQFGVFFANADEVALAARMGGLEASQTANLPAAGPVPDTIIAAIEHQLDSSQIQWSHIRLEHNVTLAGNAVVLESDSSEGFDVNPKTNLAAPLAELFPRALSFFGIQFFAANKSYEHSTVFRYELGAP
jgi:hypothetical protein